MVFKAFYKAKTVMGTKVLSSPNIVFWKCFIPQKHISLVVNLSRFEVRLAQLKRERFQSEKGELKCLEFRSQMIGDNCAWIVCELQPKITIAGEVHEFPVLRSTHIVAKKEG